MNSLSCTDKTQLSNTSSYRYKTPIPMVFWKNGILDPKDKIYKNRLTFVTWAFAECHYHNLEFACSREEAARRSGLTVREWRTQEQFFIESGYLLKTSGDVYGQCSRYRWNREMILSGRITAQEDKFVHLDVIKVDQTPIETTTKLERSQLSEKKRHNLHFETIASHLDENRPSCCPISRPSFSREKTQKSDPSLVQGIDPFYKNDIKAINTSLSNSDNEYKPRAREQTSLSRKCEVTAFFNPKTYRLRNGERLSFRMQMSIDKYSPRERERLLMNVKFYEEWVDMGKSIKRSHEAFLQHCINDDLAAKQENSQRNDFYARFMKEEHKANGMEILSTIIRLKKSDREEPITISKELPSSTFENIIENYINNFHPGLVHAT